MSIHDIIVEPCLRLFRGDVYFKGESVITTNRFRDLLLELRLPELGSEGPYGPLKEPQGMISGVFKKP